MRKSWLVYIIIILSIGIYVSYVHIKELDKKWKTAMANIKNYDAQLSGYKKKDAVYQLTVSQMKTYQDSILRELDETRKKLKIKDKDVQSMHQVASEFTKTDTLVMRDTLFKEPSLVVDTLIGDEWYNVRVGLKYPSTVAVKPSFRSDKHIIVSLKKETVNPPKKFWLFRLFQKKHRVVKVNVVENNPYVINEHSELIQIVR